MKAKMVVLGCLIGVAALAMSHEGPQTPFIAFGNPEYSQAQPETGMLSLKIGVVSIRKVFGDCKRSARYNAEVLAEQSRKRGTSDYLAQLKEALDKQGEYDAEKEYHTQQKALKYQRWVEDFYMDILRESGEVAKQKGLDLVLEKDEVDFPALSIDSTMLAIRTHKLLYSGGCLDITDEVIARLDKEEPELNN